MTIDEHIKRLKKIKIFPNGSYGASINFAIETMCKYQKIKVMVGGGYEEQKAAGAGGKL